MNENYIVINGKKVELTEEQLKQLGIEPVKKRKNLFEKVPNRETYYCLTGNGEVNGIYECNADSNEDDYNAANYFNDEAFAKQVALHQLLYRKLLKFAYDNGYEDMKEWDGGNGHWTVRYNGSLNQFVSYFRNGYKAHDVYFSSEEGANQAIGRVVEPFMIEHPEFVW